jgi:hypothetical protein
LDGCKGNCDIFKATFRGRELLYPEPFGSVTAGADKDYPVDYSHLNIMGYALGAKGIESDPDKATFPNVDTETEYGVNDKVKMKVPIFTGALGSTDTLPSAPRSAGSAWCAGKMSAGLIPNWKSATTA